MTAHTAPSAEMVNVKREAKGHDTKSIDAQCQCGPFSHARFLAEEAEVELLSASTERRLTKPGRMKLIIVEPVDPTKLKTTVRCYTTL